MTEQYLLVPNIDEIKKLIDIMYENRGTVIKLIPRDSELYRQYRLLRAKVELIRDTDDYQEVLDYLRGLMERDGPEYNLGTLGGFLFGCINKLNGSCDPYCLNAIPPKDAKWTDCRWEMWQLENGYLTKLNDSQSDRAVIYVRGNERPTPEHLETLRSQGVKTAQIYNQAGQEIGTVQIAPGNGVPVVVPVGSGKAGKAGKSSAMNWIILLVIFIVIIFFAYLIINGISKSRRAEVIAV